MNTFLRYKQHVTNLRLWLLVIALLTLSLTTKAQTVTRYWTGATSSNWFTPSNWSPSGVPGPNDNVRINLVGTSGVVRDPVITGNIATAYTVILNEGAFLTIEAGAGLTIAPMDVVSGARINCYGGRLINNGTLSIASTAGSNTLAIDLNGPNPSLINSGTIIFGGNGRDIFIRSTCALTNTGQISSSSSRQCIVAPMGAQATITNQGSIRFDGESNVISLDNSTLINSGVISTTAAGSGLALNTGSSCQNQACGQIILGGEYANEGTGTTTTNNGLIHSTTGLVLTEGTFTNNGVLHYGFLRGGNSVVSGNGSVIVNENPTNNTIFTYTGTFTGTIDDIFRNTDATVSAGTFTAPNAFVPSGLPNGLQTLYASITPSDRACSYVVPFNYTYTPPPTLTSLAATATSVCAGSPITFTATVGNVTGSYNYTLTNGSSTTSGSATNTAFSQNLTAVGSGSQSFTLIVSANGQSARSVTNVTVVQPPILTISYPGTKYCRANSDLVDPTRTITADFPMGSGVYTSSPAGLSIVAATGRVDTRASSPGDYTITYTYTSTAVCSVVTATAAMTIVGAPQFVNLSRIQPTCATPTGTISVTFTGNGTLEYSINNGSTWQTSNVFSGLAPGSYDILARSQSETGCVSNVSLISINSLQNTVRISYPAGPYCRNASTTYTASVTSTGGQGTFTNSPAGLSIDAAGTIIPNESEPGSYTVSYVSSTCTNVTATAAITIVDNLIIGLEVTQPTCATVTGTINTSVTGLSGVEYNLNGGPWQSSGLFSGLAAGQLYTVRARLASSPVCESNLTDIPINTVPTPPTVTNPTVTTATIGVPFSQSFTAVGGTGNASFSLANGATLPPGLTLSTTGVLSGTPTALGSFTLAVRATNANGCFGESATYTLTVQEPFSPIRYVKQGGAGTGSGSSWTNASADLQSQINLAGVTQVWVATGTYKPTTTTGPASRTISFSMKNGVIIYGGFFGNETVLSQRPSINPLTGQPSSTTLSGEIGDLSSRADNSYHVINNAQTGIDNTAVLDGFVITGGNANGTGNADGGGGMLNISTSPTVRNCSFLANSATFGGGMHNFSRSNPNVSNCSFQANFASAGGGMYNIFSSSPSLANCSFRTNSAFNGGGIYDGNGSSPSLTNCSFQVNTATNGGGMYNSGGSPSLTNCSFQANTASGLGGGLYNDNGSPSVTNCSFQANTASSQGGGVFTINGSPSLTNCVLFNNGGVNTFGGSARVSYSLLDESVTNFTDQGNNLRTSVSPFASTTSTQLNGCAAAINAGSGQAYTTANGPATDLAGNSRVFGSSIDMGAYEYQAAPNPGLTITNPSITTATVGTPFSQTFTASAGVSSYSFSLANGATLPTGLTLSTTGVLSGTPAQTGTFSLTVSAFDALGCSGTSATYTLTVQDAFSPIRYVKQGGAGTGSGNSWANASANLQSQINLAGVTQVWVAAGTYKPGGDANTDQSVSFSMKNGVAIYGGFANSGSPVLAERNPTTFATMLSGDIGTPNENNDNSYHVISNDSNELNATAVLDGFVITGGNGGDYGGGMYNSGSSPSVANCVFQGNTASEGGGMYNTSSSPTLNNCVFQTNTASVGGGMSNDNSSPTLTGCSFWNNQSDSYGGGMNNFNASNPTLINCLFQDNSGGFYGGGINNESSNPSLTNCSFQTNSGGLIGGGAIYNSSSNPVLTNCSFQANTGDDGGAMNNQSSSPILVNCVFFGNGGANTISGMVSAIYSLFEASETDYAGTNNLITTVSPFASTTSTQLNGCAPAINTGSNADYTSANGPGTDLAGNARVFGSAIDMGAYEYQAAPNAGLALTNPTTTTATQNSEFSGTFIASGGTSPYSFSLASGTLPTSLTLAATGVLSGTPTQTGIFSLTVSAIDALGCSGTSATYTLNVNNATPTIANFSATSASVCAGNTITFTATIGNVTGSYDYTLTNGTVATNGTASSTAFSQTLTAAGSAVQTFTLIVAAAGQRASSTTNVTVNPIPVPTLSANFGGTLTCAQTSLTLTAGGGTTYAFNGPGVVSQDPNTGTAVVSASGTYSVVVTSSGCSATTSVQISQDTDVPSVSISPSIGTPTGATLTCANPAATLTATGTGSYLWSTGATSQTISVGNTGTYSVTLTADNGCQATASLQVTADQTAPSLSISPSSATLTCANTSATLTALGTGALRWSTGSTDPQITVSTAGTYSVTLTTPGGCTATRSVTVDQNTNQPALSITPSIGTPNGVTLTCANPTATLTANGAGSYQWSTGATSQTISVGTAGTYSVTLTSSNGCSATTTVAVSGDQATPMLTITTSNTLLTCASPTASLTAIGTGTLRWSTGSTDTQISVNSGGTYSVTLTAPSGCTASASVTISQDTDLPSVSITPGSATLTCTSPSVILTANGTGTYQWSTGASSQTITASSAGTYSVTLTADNGCQATASSTIEQGADQSITFSQQPTSTSSVTVGSSVTTQVVITGQASAFQWYKDNLNQPLASQTAAQLTLTNVQLSDAGSYFVVITGPCNSLTSTAFTLSISSPVTILTLTASVSPNPIQTGQSATLTATVAGGTSPYSYTFSGPGSINPTGNTAMVTGLAAGVYSFTVSASDATQPSAQLATTTISLTVNAVETAPFAITAVTTISCSPITPNRFSVSFTPRYSGLTGQPVSFSVANEMLPTSQPGPYTIQLYTDNPTITLQASQQGATTPTSFSYNWLEACRTSESPNTPPRVVSGLTSQTAKVGDYFTYVIPENTFTDSETPLSLRLSASRLPAGLSFSGATLSGTPSTTVGSPFTVSITATDPGGLSVSTPLLLTILPATTPVEPTTPFAITGVTTISCTPIANRINISFAPLYSGLNGQPIAFEIVNERAPTTDPAPYSLTLYRDNPVITLRARQTGSAQVASFSYNWLAACSTAGQDNTPPRLNSPVGSQTATVGKSFNLNLANTFVDQETPNQLSLSATGLPQGLLLQGTAISGTPSVSGVSTVVLTATDGGGLTNTTSFELTVSPASSTTTVTPPTGFAITGVQTVSCETVSAGLRRVSFQPQYAGVTGQAISFRVENELATTTASGPYTLNLYTDNPMIRLKATQVGTAGEASFSYNWLAACSAPARVGTPEAQTRLEVTVLGNPVEGEFVEIEIRGAARQSVSAELVDQQGRTVCRQRIDEASTLERMSLPVEYSRGVLLLHVQTANQHQQLKVVVK